MVDPRDVPSRLGRYDVVAFLASGGMAEVFLGRVNGPSGFRRPVVLKRMLANLARQASFVDMFLDEARLVAQIRHPNVVQVQELVCEGGELFMVMEYLEGESVSSLVRRLVARRAALSAPLGAFIVAEACAGLHSAHEAIDEHGRPLGVVHRDVSPQNLFITFDGSVKVLDFGVAKASERLTHTKTGELKGKLDYMSPEQCHGKDVDRRTDVFALGVVLYELLTLRRLFKRSSPAATLRAILSDPLVPPTRSQPSIPRKLEAVCMKALARDPEKRYADAASMRHDLLDVVRSSTLEPADELAALMTDQFADRRAEKAEMLRRIVEGSFPTAIPAAETDDRVDIPVVVSEVTELDPPRSNARRRWLIVGAVAAATSAAGAVYALRRHDPPAVAVVPLTASNAPQRLVRVSIDSTPSGAAVEMDGLPRGRTPWVADVPFSTTPSRVTLRLQGYLARDETLDRNADQHLKLDLVRDVAPAISTTPARAAHSATPSHDVLTEKWPGR